MDEKNSKNNKLNKAFLDNKLNKYGVTKKSFYALGSLFMCIVLIVVLSITQATFNSESLATPEFWIDFIILAGLCIFGMISGQQTGDDMGRNNPNGVFRASLGKYGTTFERIDALMLFAYFDEWIDWYRERKLNKKIESILKDSGIHQMEVLKLDLLEVDKLTAPFKKVWNNGKKDTYFVTYTQEQIDLIKYCKTGNIKVSKLPRSFFLDAFYHSEKDLWESAANSSKKKTSFLSTSYLYRIFLLLSISILSAGLQPGSDDETSAATVWLSLAKRLFCVTTAFVWGIYIGFEMVKIDVTYLDFKTDILNLYYQEYELKIYVPNTLEEKAKKMYNEANNIINEEVSQNGIRNGITGDRGEDSGTDRERREKEGIENIPY